MKTIAHIQEKKVLNNVNATIATIYPSLVQDWFAVILDSHTPAEYDFSIINKSGYLIRYEKINAPLTGITQKDIDIKNLELGAYYAVVESNKADFRQVFQIHKQ